MSNEAIILTDGDRDRLARVMDRMRIDCDPETVECINKLDSEVERATIVPSDEVDPDVVTVDSQVRFHDVDTGETMTYTVTWPHLADARAHSVSVREPGRAHSVSVLAPIGMALLGTRVGQVIEWQVPVGKRRLQIDEVIRQPESQRLIGA